MNKQFKIWDIKGEKWFPIDWFYINESGQLSKCNCGYHTCCNPDDHIIAWSIPFKDKNGCQIFYGDILADEDGVIHKMEWHDFLKMYCLYSYDPDIGHTHINSYYHLINENNNLRFKIIGNMFENSVLLLKGEL